MDKSLSNFEIDFDIYPLINAIVKRNAIVYAGSGVSMSAGLPSRLEFLEESLARIAMNQSSKTKWKQTRKLLKEGDSLTLSKLIEGAIDRQQLESGILETFGRGNHPSPIHYAIAKIPFSLAITTNYDRLLESSYPSVPTMLTWRNPDALLQSLKNDHFAVVKILGDVADTSSLVLTKPTSEELSYLTKRFDDILSILFSLKTFLFVGTSVSDHNLLEILKNAKFRFGKSIGPHYAISFHEEKDNLYKSYLRKEYNILTVYCKKPSTKDDIDWRTKSVSLFLDILDGMVREQVMHEYGNEEILSDIEKYLDKANSRITSIQDHVNDIKSMSKDFKLWSKLKLEEI